MSALLTIEVDVQKFLKGTGSDIEKFAVAFEKIFNKAPKALNAIENFVGEVAPVVEAAVALVDPVAEAPAALVLSTVETGLAAISAAATAAVSGTSLLANLQNFAATVPALLTGLDIKDSKLQAEVVKIVSLIVNESKVIIPAVQVWVQQLSAKTS